LDENIFLFFCVMKNIVYKYLYLLCFFGISNIMIAQEGTITIKQDLKIDSLLNKKIELDRKRFANEYFTLQLYYGNLSKAKEILEVVREKFSDIPAEINYDNPNYKVQAGRFKNKINGLKTLDILKQIFPSAFLLKKKTI
jgi:hypothetical protein